MNKRASVIQRRLAAIFYADVAGYVRLMNADEAGTLCLLDSCREIMDRHITQPVSYTHLTLPTILRV